MIITEFEKLPIMGILRGITGEMIEPLTQTVISSGLKTIEITMNTIDASELIMKLKKYSEGNLVIGAGTVLSMQQLEEALKAGASFIVMPVIIDEIVEYCVNNKIPVFPGALTPNEIFHAWNLGATMVKVFPAKVFGLDYFKEIKAPLNNVKLMATGGVSSGNIGDFIKNGADAVSFGASIFNTEWMKNGEYNKIETMIKEMITNYRSI